MSEGAARSFLRLTRLHAFSLALAVALAAASAAAEPSAASRPLIVGQNSRVVVMEYEAWFGPQAVTFQGSSAMPLLQSPDMQPVGGGYDSADPAVVKQHVAWFEYMGIDAAVIDLTNNVSCIFNSVWFLKKYVPNCNSSFRAYNEHIRSNTGNLYPAWSGLGTSLKLIPLLGGIDGNDLIEDEDGKTAFEKEVNYFGEQMRRYPNLNVIYQSKPLMIIYLGAAQDPNRADHPLWAQLEHFLATHPAISGNYTFRLMAGYFDSQPDLWATRGTPTGPVKINPAYGFWSWVDRLNTSCTEPLCPYYPTYNEVGSRVENFTASIATPGQIGWVCPTPNSINPLYCPDDALRFGENGSYATFDSFMSYAKQLDPVFLLVHQFNEFVADEGFDANTNDDIEPADLWGSRSLKIVKDEIRAYRRAHR